MYTGGVTKVILAEPRGFCAGVDMAIKALIWLARSFPDRRVFCYHQIVHNQVIVNWFEARGVHFVEDLHDIGGDDSGVALMLSAHGSSPAITAEAYRRFDIVVDAVCPLVRKVHREMERRERIGDTIVYLSEPSHDESAGTLGHARSDVMVVHNAEEIDDLDLADLDVSLLTQTTMPHDAHLAARAKLERMAQRAWVPSKLDLCFATTNRQAAVKALARVVDAVVVVGSERSSNTKSLALVARSAGVEQVYRVNDPVELPADLSGVVGITAGASAPEELVQRICRHLMPSEGVEVLPVLTEIEYFPQPPSLRAVAASYPDRAAPFNPEPGCDRDLTASELLASL